MNASHPPILWTSWLKWLLVTFIGLVAGLIIFVLIGSLLGTAGEEAPPFVFGLVLGAIFGTAFGVAHWIFLRRYIPGLAAWIPATTVAFAFAAMIIFGLLDGDNQEPSNLVRISHAALVGFSLGIAQWLVIRNRLGKQAGLWIVFSVVGWMLGEFTGIILTDLAEEPLPLMVIFLVGASLPGIGIVWLLQRKFQGGTVK